MIFLITVLICCGAPLFGSGENIWRMSGNICGTIENCCSEIGEMHECLVGVAITQAMMPYTISVPGNYYLCESVTASGAPAITITVSNVSLNLNGHTITNIDNEGIDVGTTSGLTNVVIENGIINSSLNGLNIGNGLFTLSYITLRDLTVNSAAGRPIDVDTVNVFTMSNCSANANNNNISVVLNSITSAVITDSVAFAGADGFQINQPGGFFEITNCRADTVASIGFSINRTVTTVVNVVVRNCGASNAFHGFVISGFENLVLENCVAQANSSDGVGFVVVGSTGTVLKGCISDGNGDGFKIIDTINTVCENCVANNNGFANFWINTGSTGNINSTCNNCTSSNGRFGFLIDSGSSNTVISTCIASGNNGVGINNSAPSTFLIDNRSSNGATATNPAYSLNAGMDVVGGATVVVIS